MSLRRTSYLEIMGSARHTFLMGSPSAVFALTARPVSASDQIVLGFMGCGDPTGNLMRARGTLLCWLLAMAWIAVLPAPGYASGSGLKIDEDPRLRKRVTLQLGKRPLSAAAAELGRLTGIGITAQREVADEPAIVIATNRSAGEVMDQLALLFGYRWAGRVRRRTTGTSCSRTSSRDGRRRRYSCVFIAVLAGAAAALCLPALAADSGAPSVIVVGSAAPPAVQRGARELQTYLERLAGARLPIVTDRQALPERCILVGPSLHLAALGVKLDAARLGPEGFLLKSVGSRLVVAGHGPRGTMYGCTTLLERLGVRWFTPTVTRVPRLAALRLPRLDEVRTPAFEYREPFFTEAQDRDWAARLKVNGFGARLDETTGGRVIYYPFVHSFDELIPRKLFAAHPEYFPLIAGARKDGYVQRCLTHPDVLRLAIEKVRQWIREHPEAQIYSVSQNDTHNFCECDACAKIARQYGGQSGLYLWFVNQVAEAMEKDHPDRLFDTLAYQFTEAAPTGIAPRRNVRVRLCPIACCEAHPYERCSHPANAAFLTALRAWARLTNNLYIWHYNTNFAHYLMPFPDFAEFPAEARLYRRTGVKGIFFQGAYAPGGGGSDAELRSYVMAKLLWDVNADTDALATEWMRGVYGPAWRPMRRWFDRLQAEVCAPDRHFFVFTAPSKTPYLTPAVLAEGDRLFAEAERLAAADRTALDYVAKARLSLRYAKLMLHPQAGPEFERFMADVRKRGITQLREGQELDAWEKAYREVAPQ